MSRAWARACPEAGSRGGGGGGALPSTASLSRPGGGRPSGRPPPGLDTPLPQLPLPGLRPGFIRLARPSDCESTLACAQRPAASGFRVVIPAAHPAASSPSPELLRVSSGLPVPSTNFGQIFGETETRVARPAVGFPLTLQVFHETTETPGSLRPRRKRLHPRALIPSPRLIEAGALVPSASPPHPPLHPRPSIAALQPVSSAFIRVRPIRTPPPFVPFAPFPLPLPPSPVAPILGRLAPPPAKSTE